MAEQILFPDFREEPDWDRLDQEGLCRYRAQIRSRMERLEAREPEDMESEGYEAWADDHEILEDLLEDVQDRLDQLQQGGCR